MIGLPRLLLGSAFLSSPFFFILFVLVMTEALDATSAWLAAILGYAGVVLLFRPLVSGFVAWSTPSAKLRWAASSCSAKS